MNYKVKTPFMELYEELSMLNEAYNIPYSGWVVVSENGTYFNRDAKSAGEKTKYFTDNIQEASIFKTEENAGKAKAWCYQAWDNKADFYLKYVESNNDLDKAELEKKLFKILNLYESFVEAGINFQKLCGQDDFKNFMYSEVDYKNKKQAPNLLIGILSSDDSINKMVKSLGNWMQEVIKLSKRADDDTELVDKGKKFVQAWNALVNEITGNKAYRQEMVELLKKI